MTVVARAREDYRGYQRALIPSCMWQGLPADKKLQHPSLVKYVGTNGNVSYRTARDENNKKLKPKLMPVA